MEDATQALIDRSSLLDLINLYLLAVDEKRLQESTELYVDGFVMEFPAISFRLVKVNAATAIRYHLDQDEPLENIQGNKPFAGTQHVVTNVLVDLYGDRANVRANFIAIHVHQRSELESHFDVGGFYEFEALRTEVGWQLSRMKETTLWVGGIGPGPDVLGVHALPPRSTPIRAQGI